MLLAQAKAFLEKKYEGGITKMMVFLNREEGTRWDVRTKHQASLISL